MEQFLAGLKLLYQQLPNMEQVFIIFWCAEKFWYKFCYC